MSERFFDALSRHIAGLGFWGQMWYNYHKDFRYISDLFKEF
jgi:hypothetical protein